MQIKRKYRSVISGAERERTDEEIVQEYLEGYIDHYSGGAIEQLERKVENIARNTAKILLALNQQAVLDICEDK